jgi:hypothetical protein
VECMVYSTICTCGCVNKLFWSVYDMVFILFKYWFISRDLFYLSAVESRLRAVLSEQVRLYN